MEETVHQQAKRPSSALTIDRAAFLLLRVKKAFKKKRQQRKEKNAAAAVATATEAFTSVAGGGGGGGIYTGVGGKKQPPPLLRSRTLPAIIAPGFNIIQAQIDPNNQNEYISQSQQLSRGHPAQCKVSGLRHQTPRISFTCNTELSPCSDLLQELRRKSATSRLGCPSPRGSITSTCSDSADGNVMLRVPSPLVDGRISRGSVSSTSSRLSRFLNQKSSQPTPAEDDNGVRRLSWERREKSGSIPRSSSIDSMVEAVWAGPRKSEPAPMSLTVTRADRALSLVSPAVGRRAKQQRGITELPYGALLEGCAGELPSLSACAPQSQHYDYKMTKKKESNHSQDRLTQVNIHSQALFAAVENGHLDKARNILESTDVDVNSLNSDGLSPLDVAVLVNNRSMAKVLMEFGAKEGVQFPSSDILISHLRRLSRDAEARLHEFIGCQAPGSRTSIDDLTYTRSSAQGTGGAGTTGCAGGVSSERDKQTLHWEKRLKALRRLTLGFQQIKVPDAPAQPELEVCGSTAVTIRLKEAQHISQQESFIFTKFRVQWSARSDFSNICGTREVNASTGNTKVIATGLTRGRRYYFRAQAGNIKGWGPFANSTPNSVIPSSWRDADGIETNPTLSGMSGAAVALDRLCGAAKLHHTHQRQRQKKHTTIRQLFTAASKFQKNLRRGVYLACILYHEDKVLVTNEDFVPVIEVDETYPTCIYGDFHWFMKVSCSWDDVKSLRADMEKHTSSSIHFRLKLLTAAAQMQSALCIQDLGQLYHKPLRDSHGTIVLSCVRSVRSPKSISVLNARWQSAHRLRARHTITDDDTIAELLMASVPEQISYNQVSNVQLSRGLYLGYLKLQSSVDLVRVVVPSRTPNVVPHTKVRENPHISAEEWEYLKTYKSKKSNAGRRLSIISLQQDSPSESQQIFLELITSGLKRLFKEMDVPLENALVHRVYDIEVVELNSDVSFIMVCPSSEYACLVPGQKEILLQRGDLLSLPIQAFEMVHLQTYHSDLLQKYSKLSCILELDVALATHSHREAFSSLELQAAKEKLTKLEDLQNNLNSIWKAARWLMDLISFARDKDKNTNSTGIPIKNIFEKITCTDYSKENNSTRANDCDTIDLLQIPTRDGKVIKTQTGRGSWPGPSNNTNILHPEMSRSEQHLSTTPGKSSSSTLNLTGSQYLSATSDQYPSSATNQTEHAFLNSKNTNSFRLPPSRSEDTLYASQNKKQTKITINTSTTSYSTSSSPLLNVKGSCKGSMLSIRTNKTESMHSLSSDSESHSCPTKPVTPTKNSSAKTKLPPPLVPSRSMSNVKYNVEPTTESGDGFLKPSSCLKPTLKPIKSDGESDMCDHDSEGASTDESKSCEKKPSESPGILQVYAAYETGLAAGTSLKLHVTPRTSAREVINLVVQQLYMAAVLKGKSGPFYGPDKLNDFCLVAVIGARERCLRDDFRPLQLQNPWRKGRLYVRLKHDVLAAIEQSTKQPAYI